LRRSGWCRRGGRRAMPIETSQAWEDFMCRARARAGADVALAAQGPLTRRA